MLSCYTCVNCIKIWVGWVKKGFEKTLSILLNKFIVFLCRLKQQVSCKQRWILSDTNHFHFLTLSCWQWRRAFPTLLNFKWHKSKWLQVFLKTCSAYSHFPSILPIASFWSCKWKCNSMLHFSTNCRTFIEIQWFEPACHSGDIPAVRIEFPTMKFPILGFKVFPLCIGTPWSSVQPMCFKWGNLFKKSQSFQRHPIVWNCKQRVKLTQTAIIWRQYFPMYLK